MRDTSFESFNSFELLFISQWRENSMKKPNPRYSNEHTKPNISIPTDAYFDVKAAAAKERKTVSEFIQEAILEKTYRVLGKKKTA
jgi:hypothetical protein